MPAKNLHRIDEERASSHIYNRGIENRIIFAEAQDYDVFLGYIKEYLSPLRDPESAKKDFTVNGKVFRGTPHQPKNYFNRVELIAYSLMPTHFHLLLHQVTKGSLENFIRSLCTRYSMYFNKKYKRSGALFEGPYKSVHVEDEAQILLLTRYFHDTGNNSSYLEYLGKRDTSWVKPQKGKGDYKNFVESELGESQKELLRSLTLENESQHLERRDVVREGVKTSSELPLEIPSESKKVQTRAKQSSRMPEFFGMAALFVILLSFGVRNIDGSKANGLVPAPSTLGVSSMEDVKTTEVVEPNIAATSEAELKTMAVIRIKDGALSVNIRKEPSVLAVKVGDAKESDAFEIVSVGSKWYEVKLADQSIGFISSTYIKEEVR